MLKKDIFDRLSLSGQYAKLENKKVVLCDANEWLEFFREPNRRIVAEDVIAGCRISTVFLGINHNFSAPYDSNVGHWFETMVFDKDFMIETQRRYSTWEDAVQGHEEILEDLLKKFQGESRFDFMSELNKA